MHTDMYYNKYILKHATSHPSEFVLVTKGRSKFASKHVDRR